MIYVLFFQIFFSSVSFSDEKKVLSYAHFQELHAPLIEALKKTENADHNQNADQHPNSLESLKKWQPEDVHLKPYKLFFEVLWSNDFEAMKSLYKNLKKEKKYIRLRLDLLKNLFNEKPVPNSDFLKKESRILLKQIRGTSEGEIFETLYLKWLNQNKLFSEICSHERQRWISEPNLDFGEMTLAIEKCPLKFEDFLNRLRRLIFAAKETQAQHEIDILANDSNEILKTTDWQKIYIQAIFDSHVGDPTKAFKNLEKFEKEILDSDFSDNYFYIAQRAGELQKAEDVISQIVDKASGKNKNELKFQQGFLFYQTKRYAKAFEIFDQIYKSHLSKNKKRKNKDFDQIAWLRAWVLFLDKKYDKSLKAFEDTKKYSNDTARLNYWIAMNLLKLDEVASAQSIFKKLSEPLADQQSFSFYNLMGWLRFQEYKSQFKNNDLIKNLIFITKNPNGFFPAPDDQVTRSQMLQQYNELTNESFTTDEGEIQVRNTENEVLASDELQGISVDTKSELLSQIFWAKLLIENNQPELAKWHLFELEKNIKDRKKSDSIVQFYLDQKFYYRALSLQQKLGLGAKANRDLKTNANTPTNTTTNYNTNYKSDPILWGALYPEAYKKTVTQFSDEKKIDPYLIWSIMRAETQYKADAISPVGAVGLMQFMPYTAQKISNLLSQKTQAEDLFKPEKSIEYGAMYLKKLSLELDDQKPLIAAAYNGGPHRVKQWLKNLGQMDYDIFIEHIPFAETRTYTKRVLTYRSMYEKIYNGNLNYEKMKYLIEKIPFAAPENFKLSEEWEFKK